MAQSDADLTGDQEISFDSCMARQLSFVEIDHEIFSSTILSLSADSRRVVVSFWQKNVHKYWLTN